MGIDVTRVARGENPAKAATVGGGHGRSKRVAALVALCMAALTCTASAQQVTAESARAALDRANEAIEAANRSIEAAREANEEARATGKSTVTQLGHLPSDRMPLMDYVGAILISVESGWVMQVDRTAIGGPVVRLHELDGNMAGMFLLGQRYTGGTEEAALQAVVQTGFAKCADDGQPRIATLARDGSGLYYRWSCSDSGRLINYNYHLEASGPGIKAKTYIHVPATAQVEIVEHEYLPITDELAVATATRLQERREEERRRAEEVRLQREREVAAREARSAERWAVFGAVMQGAVEGMAQGMPGYSDGPRDAYGAVSSFDHAQADMAATVEGIQRRAAAERAQQSGVQTPADPGSAGQPRVAEHAQGYGASDGMANAASPSGTTQYSALKGTGTGAWETAGAESSRGEASTRDDPSTCVSPPVTSTHQCASLSGYKARVSNNCAAPVDIRVCFMTDTGWNCQSNYGVAPGEDWEPGWCHANTGQTFHSSRYNDSNEKLESP